MRGTTSPCNSELLQVAVGGCTKTSLQMQICGHSVANSVKSGESALHREPSTMKKYLRYTTSDERAILKIKKVLADLRFNRIVYD
jgi:hypothetical protein